MNFIQSKRKNRLFVAVIFWATLLVYSPFSQAFDGYQTTWEAENPNSESFSNAQCQLCHAAGITSPPADNPPPTYKWNAYGWAIKNLAGTGTLAERILAVEGLDSDEDLPLSSSNEDEIDASTQPGWTEGDGNKTYDTNGVANNTTVSAPGTITGNLDIPAYSIGGTISGLAGSVTLRNNGGNDLTTSNNGEFTFSTKLAEGSDYLVTVFSQPEGQTCSVTSGGDGTVGTADVTNVTVTCVDEEDPTYSLGGTITGLAGSVTLKNSDNELTTSDNGPFTFSTELIEGTDYSVTVSSQPTGQTCSVTSGGSGTIGTVDVTDVVVVCVNNTYSVGGNINGLVGSVTLQNNGGDDNLTTSDNGGFVFTNLLDNGSTYAVTVSSQPTGQNCEVTNGNGTIALANVTDVSISCSNVLGVAHVEWEEFPYPAVPIPLVGNFAMVIIGFALLLIGLHYIRRQHTAIAKMLAIFAISSGVLISTQNSYQFIDKAIAASQVLLTVSPEPIGLGDNGIRNTQSQRIQITGLTDNTCEFDQTMSNAPACGVGTALQPGESCYVYVTCDPGSPKVSSPDEFLQFFNPISEEDDAVAAAQYYQVIDPDNNKDTLEKWKTQVGFDSGYDSLTIYLNDTDLGFGRRMFVRSNPDGSVASYVENYPTLQDATDETNIIATVAMEYSDPAATGTQFTQFYTFGPNSERLMAVDLDGRGERYQPGVCNVCHGGKPKSSYATALDANTGAGFLPWDLDTFVYATAPEELTREAQEGEFKKQNEAVLDTNPTAAALELIEGWYGGIGLPGSFDGDYAPDAWVVNPVDAGDSPVNVDDATALYEGVVAPYCRACHIQRSPDFSSYKNFDQNSGATKTQVFDQGTMPLALRTFEKFWHNSEHVEILADYLGVDPEPNPHSP